MKKILTALTTLIFAVSPVFAESIESVIQKSPVSKNATVSVSVRSLNSGHVIYENESNKLLNPASTLKLFTYPVILNQLSDSYDFVTGVYKDGVDTVYLKVSGDPAFSTKALKDLMRGLRNADVKQPQKFYIDDTALDDIEYGIGWQWDDEVSTFIPKVSRYNIDTNIYTLGIQLSQDKKSVTLKQPYNYNVAVVNRLQPGSKNNIIVKRNFWEGAEKVTLSGTVSSSTSVRIPAYNQKRFFLSSLQEAMNNANIRYFSTIQSKKIPTNATLVQEYKTNVKPMYSQMLKNSNNMVAETLFKTAGGKYINGQGSFGAGVEAFKNYYKNIGVNTDDIIIVDGSGVSRNDLLTTDWMTNALVKISKNDSNFKKQNLMKPNEGTMKDRLFDLRDYLWAKTGTLANTSGLTGFLTTKSGNELVFAILIQNTNLPEAEAKKLEDEILMTLYKKY